MASLPQFTFPTGLTGWLVVIASAVVGLVAGGLAMNLARSFLQ